MLTIFVRAGAAATPEGCRKGAGICETEPVGNQFERQRTIRKQRLRPVQPNLIDIGTDRRTRARPEQPPQMRCADTALLRQFEHGNGTSLDSLDDIANTAQLPWGQLPHLANRRFFPRSFQLPRQLHKDQPAQGIHFYRMGKSGRAKRAILRTPRDSAEVPRRIEGGSAP